MIDSDNSEIVLEIRNLVDDIGKFKEEVDIYSKLIKQMFLSVSGNN